MTDLKPCPFCGAVMEDYWGHSFAHPLVETEEESCILAGLAFSYVHSRWGTDERERWNRRADAPEVQALIAKAVADERERVKQSVMIGVGAYLASLPHSMVDEYARRGLERVLNANLGANT